MHSFEDSIGKTVEIKGVTLKVLSFERIDGYRYWTVSCEACEQRDLELWPRGSIKARYDNIRKGFIPCGCSKSPHYNQEQKEILARRYAARYGYKVLEVGKGSLIRGKVEILCPDCSKDPEMFGEGKYYTSVQNLQQGKTPCPCFGIFRYSENQYKVLCRRKSEDLGVDFIGWHGDYKKIYTKPLVMCRETGSKKYYKSIEGFLATKIAKIPVKLLGNSWQGDKGNILTVVEQKGEDLKISCSECSKNPQWYPETFESKTWMVLRRSGYSPCGCNPTYSYSNNMLKDINLNWLGKTKLELVSFPPEDFVWGVKSKVTLRCPSGHVYDKSFDSIINTKTKSCGVCAKDNRNGFCPDRIEEEDFLYILDFNGEYLKVGRSFIPSDRFVQLSRESGIPLEYIKVLQLYKAAHKKVYNTEQKIHDILEEKGYYHHESVWSTETFHLECKDLAKSLALGFNLEPLSNKL